MLESSICDRNAAYPLASDRKSIIWHKGPWIFIPQFALCIAFRVRKLWVRAGIFPGGVERWGKKFQNSFLRCRPYFSLIFLSILSASVSTWLLHFPSGFLLFILKSDIRKPLKQMFRSFVSTPILKSSVYPWGFALESRRILGWIRWIWRFGRFWCSLTFVLRERWWVKHSRPLNTHTWCSMEHEPLR